MSTSRRDFIRTAGLAGTGLASVGLYGSQTRGNDPFPQDHKQVFNMSGYAAPKLDVVRIGIIGLGNRGTGTVRRLASIEGVEIRALCDLEPNRVERSLRLIEHLGQKPDSYSGNPEAWKKVCERADIDLIAIVTPWHLHTPMCVFAMEHDKHAYTELPAATTMEECWKLVATSERTRKHCVQMSSNCHDGIAAVVLNMVRDGFFGELIHAEGCYIHDLLLGYNFTKTMYHNMWRLNANIGRHGNLYPQHGIVPIIQMMDLTCGDRMDYLVSLSSRDFMMGETARRLAAEDRYWQQYVGRDYRGNMNITVFKTVKGRSIVLQHDVSSPRPRGGRMLSGTRCIYQSHPDRFATSHDGWLPEADFKALVDKYTPELTRRFNEWSREAEKIQRGGHSYHRVTPTDWRLIDCLRNGLPMGLNVYEAAFSSSVTPLSIWSVANGSQPVAVPDFTCGKWETNQRPLDLQLKRGGGSTRLI
jgi:hypothetical protein